MEVAEQTLMTLETPQGQIPFEDWLESLKSNVFRAAVDARLTRVADGNFGDHKSVGGGVFELRIPKGPGLRIYYGLDGPRLVVLIGGGDKSSQKKDILKAQELWKEYLDAK